MQVLTAFANCPPQPIVTAIYDDKVEVVPLYLKGTGRSLFDIESDIKAISDRINDSHSVLLNDAKSHLRIFNLGSVDLYQLNVNIPPKSRLRQYTRLFETLMPLNAKEDYWRKLLATASEAYITMEDRDVYLDEKRVYPHYSLDTFSGRSRCTNFNIQGAPEGVPIKTDDELFVCLDWISADLRVAAAMSGDDDLAEMFENSDPYSNIAELLNITRDECKILLLKTLYSIDINSPILDIFPTLKNWIKNRLEYLDNNGWLPSLLGRKFNIKTRDKLSVFNATLQGTVAHAMHSALNKMHKDLRRFLVTETHDSIVFSCNRGILTKLLRVATSMMTKPLDELPRLPLKAYIGKEWKRWKLYKVYK